jgi:hypothetical protein
MIKPKTKTKTGTETTVSSQIKRLAAKSMKRPRYIEELKEEDEDSHDEEWKREKKDKEEKNCVHDQIMKQRELEMNEEVKVNRSNANRSHVTSAKNYPKTSKRKRAKQSISTGAFTTMSIVAETSSNFNDDEEKTIIKEQQRLEQLAVQEREDRELALKLQARFNAMERIAGRTRRRAARISSPLLN